MTKERGQDTLSAAFELATTQRTLPIALLRAREAIMQRMRPVLHKHGMTEQQWRVIRVLSEEGALDATALAAHACILSPSLTRMLKALEARGLLTTSKDPDDGRRLVVELTQGGADLIATLTPSLSDVYAGIEAAVGLERIDDLLNDLEVMNERLG